MIWQVTAFNGTQWTAKNSMSLEAALDSFYRTTELHEQDVKEIVRVDNQRTNRVEDVRIA
ncbi:hypothetical protein [Pseudomonas phage D6]|nr:hypothetical protein [Pseudomonas phage D6]